MNLNSPPPRNEITKGLLVALLQDKDPEVFLALADHLEETTPNSRAEYQEMLRGYAQRRSVDLFRFRVAISVFQTLGHLTVADIYQFAPWYTTLPTLKVVADWFDRIQVRGTVEVVPACLLTTSEGILIRLANRQKRGNAANVDLVLQLLQHELHPEPAQPSQAGDGGPLTLFPNGFRNRLVLCRKAGIAVPDLPNEDKKMSS